MYALTQVMIYICVFGAFLRRSMAGEAFLPARDWAPSTAWEANVQKDLLEEIGLSRDARVDIESRLSPIEKALNKSVLAMQKNVYGKLGHSAVRYMLHRYFVQRHGWFVKGIDPNGGALNSSSPVEVLRKQMSVRVMGLLERRLGGQGFELREIAILAAMVEATIQSEATRRLEAAYNFLHYPIVGAPIMEFQVNNVLDTHFQTWIMQVDITKVKPRVVRRIKNRIIEYYPTWPATERFLREARSIARPNAKTFSFSDTVAVLMQALDTYGHEQGKECLDLKQHLLDLEERKGSGCVRLSDFYGSNVGSGKWQFSETSDYLRRLGALEESDPKNPRVLVPNYLGGQSNCLASGEHYTVCCLNECESLMDHIEVEIAAPDATPVRIIDVVTALPSASVAANRTLPSTLIHRLSDIAQHHGGRVPLHGRLFAQWMHNAYPRECAFPHASGATNPLSQTAALQQGVEISHTQDQMASLVNEASKHNVSTPARIISAESCVPWQDEEELFVPWTLKPQEPLEDDPHLWAGFRIAAISSMIASITLLFLHSMRLWRHAVGTWFSGSLKSPSMIRV
jgi:hypothetical protein